MDFQNSKLTGLCFSAILALLLSMSGCSSDSYSGNSSALPQPSVNCGGESCID